MFLVLPDQIPFPDSLGKDSWYFSFLASSHNMHNNKTMLHVGSKFIFEVKETLREPYNQNHTI